MFDRDNRIEREILDDINKEISAFIGNIIGIADYYNYNRDKLLNNCSVILSLAVRTASFEDYMKDEEMN